MKTKIESPFLKTALLVLDELEYGKVLSHSKFEVLRDLIAKNGKLFFLLGKKEFDINDCKDFLADFDDTATIDELLDKITGEQKEN